MAESTSRKKQILELLLFTVSSLLLSVAGLKYGKPIWQWVAEAAELIDSEEFTSADIVKKVHEANSAVPEVSIKSYVTAMAPNHPFSGHWPSIRKNHPYFYYLGNGKFKLQKPTQT